MERQANSIFAVRIRITPSNPPHRMPNSASDSRSLGRGIEECGRRCQGMEGEPSVVIPHGLARAGCGCSGWTSDTRSRNSPQPCMMQSCESSNLFLNCCAKHWQIKSSATRFVLSPHRAVLFESCNRKPSRIADPSPQSQYLETRTLQN